jgi:polyphosphate glucokinase
MDSLIAISSTESLRLFYSADDLFQAAAEDFVIRTSQSIEEKGVCNVVLSGGNTPKHFFDALTQTKRKIAWDKIRFFFGDERYVPLDDPQSNYHTAKKFLFSKVPIPVENIYPIPTQLASAAASAEQYEKTLRELFHLQEFQWPAFDIIYLGMGDNGHTASLMPFTDLVKSYIQAPFLPTLVASLWVEQLQMYRVTLTPPAINHGAYIAFLVEGEAKAAALKEVIENKKDTLKYPAILIKNAVWFADEAAAEQLSVVKSTLLTLCIDIGGTGIKMMVLDNNGNAKTDYRRELTPHPATYEKSIALIKKMIQQEPVSFDRVSAGFPGAILDGIVMTAHNFDPSWVGINLQKELERITAKPARVANDADVQGEGDICGKGVELVITLGTGVGSALFVNGQLVPNLQLAHHPFMDNKTYEELLGKAALEKIGEVKWNSYLQRAIVLWAQTFNYQYLYIGGGYAEKISFPLPKGVQISNNIQGILGGIKLWG